MGRKKYRYLLFDLDGTLTDPREGITRSVQHALRHFGIETDDPGSLTKFIGPPLIPSFMEFCGLSREQAEEALRVYRERFSTVGLYENRVLEGVPEMLQELSGNGVFMAIASSKPEPFVCRILEHFELGDHFQTVTGASMDEKLSEKADVIAETLRRIPGDSGVDRGEVLMVGDRKHDIQGARACGIDSLGVYTGFAPEGELEAAGADYVCHSVEEMAALLLSLTE